MGLNQRAQFDYAGLDDAEVHPPDLPEGTHVLEIVKNEEYEIKGDVHMSVVGKVLQTDTSTVKVGSTYKAKISYLFSRSYPESKGGLKTLRQCLAAALGVDADQPPPSDVASSWTDLALKVQSDPEAMAGDRVMVKATPATNPKYCNYAFLPAPE